MHHSGTAFRLAAAAALALSLCAPATAADTVSAENGGDTFIAGDAVIRDLDAPRDAFVTGRSVVLRGAVADDLHTMGFDVSVNAGTAGDLYAAGATVLLRGQVAGDLSAVGFTVRTEEGAATQGNARLMGGTVVIDGPVEGALSVIGRNVVLNAPVAGDARLVAQTITFGKNASVQGRLTYGSDKEIAVPERVAPAARVTFERLSRGEMWDEMSKKWNGHDFSILPTIASMIFGFAVTLLFFIVVGALALGFVPDRVERLRRGVTDMPGQTVLAGVAGLSMLFGLVPVTGLTIVGLPFVPVILLTIVLAWILGYVLGAYAVALRLWIGLGGDPDPGNVTRLMVLAAAVTLVALLNFIPFLGWVANYTLVLLGIGAMAREMYRFLLGSPAAAADAGPARPDGK